MKPLAPGRPCAKSRVLKVQRILLLDETGEYDSKTVNAVREFQKNQKLKVDGETGPKTWDAMVAFVEAAGRGPQAFERLSMGTVVLRGADEVQKRLGRDSTYTRVQIRSDVAHALHLLEEEIFQLGGVLTTAGAIRPLTALVTAGRVAMSGHYLCRDLDLGLPTGMQNPDRDPFIVERAPDLGARRWRVWMKCSLGAAHELRAVIWGQKSSVAVVHRVVDLTDLAGKYGFVGISCHKGSWWEDKGQLPAGRYSGVEWWHSGHRIGLEPGETTFGDELLRVYSLSSLVGTPPWENRHAVYREDWF